jgi:peptidyl-tRNA hydrolase
MNGYSMMMIREWEKSGRKSIYLSVQKQELNCIYSKHKTIGRLIKARIGYRQIDPIGVHHKA